MTEQTIRLLAKKFAGEYYESAKRSEEFRNGTMTVVAYKTVRVKVGNVWVHKEVPFNLPFCLAFKNVDAYVESAWPHWVDYAREKMSEMLGMPDARISPVMKKRIYDAIIDDREREFEQRSLIEDPFTLRRNLKRRSLVKHLRQLRGPDEPARGFTLRDGT